MITFAWTVCGFAVSPTPPGDCVETETFTTTQGGELLDTTTVSSTIEVAGLHSYIWDVDLVIGVHHPFSDDLDIKLFSPAGTEVTITTDNGETNDDVFDDTVWDDDAGDTNPPGAVTQTEFANGVAEATLAPEEGLASLVGENPNGTWTLEVRDDGFSHTGTFTGWSLTITALAASPTSSTTTFTDTPGAAISDDAEVTRTLNVSGADTRLCDLNLVTNVTHEFPNDLDITLQSPGGTVVTITTDNGVDRTGVFAGTVWDDNAGDTNPPGPVTDATFEEGVLETTLAPEEPLGAFIGEDPNGTWTLTVADDSAGNDGTLVSWSLQVATCTADSQSGCDEPVDDTDSDGDGVPDDADGCPHDADKSEPGVCGCGTPDADSDGDGTFNCHDECPSDPSKTEPGACGCGSADDDTTGDGQPDCVDDCPDDPDKSAPGVCGCGVPDADADSDGTLDCDDACPHDPAKTAAGTCGCGVADTDSDSDGIADCDDEDVGGEVPGDGDGDADGDGGSDDDTGGSSTGGCAAGLGGVSGLTMLFALLLGFGGLRLSLRHGSTLRP